MADTPQVLLVCSLSKAHHDLAEASKQQGVRSISAFTVRDAESILLNQALAFVICAAELLDGTFRDILRILQKANLKVPVLVICRGGDREEYSEAKHLGAVDCMPRPLSLAHMGAIIQAALREITSAGKRPPSLSCITKDLS